MEIATLIHRPSEQMPPTQFVGGIFPRKHITIVAAKAGVGKTWFVLKTLTDLSRGGTIMNGAMAYYEPPRKCLLLVGESGLELVNERQRSMHDKAVDDNFAIISRIEALKHKIVLDVDRPDGVQGIYNICKVVRPDIVALDTLMSFRSDDENAMQNSNIMLSRLQYLADSFSCAIIVTHHIRKRQSGVQERIDQDEIVGSSALVRQSGCAWILTKNGRNYALHPVKTWWKVPELIEWRMVDRGGEIFFDEAKWEEGGNVTTRRLRAEDYLRHLEPDETVTVKDIADKFGFGKPFAQQIIQSCCDLVSESQGSAPAVYGRKAIVA